MSAQQVWKMFVSCEEDRPQIDLAAHDFKPEDWGDMEQTFPTGVDVIQAPPTLCFHVGEPNALEWDWYAGIGVPPGIWSQRAKDLLYPHAKQHLRWIQTTLNGAPYYFVRMDRALGLDCLDLTKSDIQYFDDAGTQVWKILRYAFRTGVIHDPLIFHTPQKSDLLATASIRKLVENAGLNGFVFYDAANLYAYYGRPQP